VVEIVNSHGTPSHYSRRHADGTIYLPQTMSVRAIYDMFLEEKDPSYATELKERREVLERTLPSRKPILSF
jgi:hypothetical protein